MAQTGRYHLTLLVSGGTWQVGVGKVEMFSDFPYAGNSQLRTGADKGNPTV
jgi:hypothetical protein